jgi:uncharacterized protein GlcG (DUF336 family)
MKTSLMLFCFLLLCQTAALAQTSATPLLTLAEAEKIADAAIQRAKQDNWNVAVAITDQAGHLIILKTLDGTQFGSIQVAIDKAKCAIHFKRSTKAFEDLVKQGNVHLVTLPGIVAVEGGVPIVKNGVFVGAIGISGVTSVQDGIIAEAALKNWH